MRHLNFILFCLVSLSLQAQSSNSSDDPIEQIYISASRDIGSMLVDPISSVFFVNTANLFHQTNSLLGYFDLHITIGQKKLTLRIKKQELRAPSYQSYIQTDKGAVSNGLRPTLQNCPTYTGYVLGKDMEKVYMYLTPSTLLISLKDQHAGKSTRIRPYNNKVGYMLYEEKTIEDLAKTSNACATQSNETPASISSCGSLSNAEKCYYSPVTTPTQTLYLDWAFDVDYEFFTNHHSYGNNITDPLILELAKEQVESAVLEIVSESQIVLNTYFNLLPAASAIFMFTTPDDPYIGGIHLHWDQMSDLWNTDSDRRCVPYDAAQLLSGKDLDAPGFVKSQGIGDMCDGINPPFSYGTRQNFAVSRHLGPGVFHTVAIHELIHNLGNSFHTEFFDYPSDCTPSTQCGWQYHLSNQTEVVMCKQEGNNVGMNVIAGIEQCFIYNLIQESSSCLQSYAPLENCERCLIQYSISADDKILTSNCEGNDLVNFTVTVCNTCEARNINIDFHRSKNKFTMVNIPPGFSAEQPSNVSAALVMYSSNVSFAPLECKSFIFTARLTVANEARAGIKLTADGAISSYRDVGVTGLPDISRDLTNYTILSQYFAIPPNFGPFPLPETACAAEGVERFIIRNTLEIDEDYCFINDEFELLPGAKIIVLPGVHLKLKNCSFFGCNNMWDYIQVSRFATVEAEGCLIKHAINGFKLDAGGTLMARNCQFVNNYIGILAESSNLVSELLVSGGNFRTEGVLFPPYDGKIGYAGIKATNLLNIQVLTAQDLSSGLVGFDRLVNGILAKGCALEVDGATFKNIGPLSGVWQGSPWGRAIQAEGLGTTEADLVVKHADFDDCHTGIRASETHISVESSDFNDVDNGITALLCRNRFIDISGNSIVARSSGVSLSYNAPALVSVANNFIQIDGQASANTGIGLNINEGIANNSLSNYVIYENNIFISNARSGIRQYGGAYTYYANNTISMSGIATATGIALEGIYKPYLSFNTISGPETAYANRLGITAEGLSGATIECNTFKQLGRGTWFRMLNDATQLRGNTYLRANQGLRLGDLLAGGSIENAAIGNQNHQGNHWIGPFDEWGAFHASQDPPIWLQSRFIVNSQANPAYLPSNNVGGEDWFDNDPDPLDISFICPTPPSNPLVAPLWPTEYDEGDKLDRAIALDSFAVQGYELSSAWTGKQRLLRRWSGGGASGPLVAPFLAAQANSAANDYRQVAATLESALFMSEQDWATLSTSLSNLRNAQAALHQNAQTYPWAGNRSVLLQQMWNARQSLGQITATKQSTQDQGISTAKVTAAALVANNVPQNNEKTVLIAYSQLLLAGTQALSSADSITLADIAAQCSYSGGDAVYQARAFYGLFDPLAWHTASCPSVVGGQALRNRPTNDTPPPLSVSVYPNPGREYILLTANQALAEANSSVVVFDILLRQKSIPCQYGTQHNCLLDVSTLSPGLYWLQLQASSGERALVKFIKN